MVLLKICMLSLSIYLSMHLSLACYLSAYFILSSFYKPIISLILLVVWIFSPVLIHSHISLYQLYINRVLCISSGLYQIAILLVSSLNIHALNCISLSLSLRKSEAIMNGWVVYSWLPSSRAALFSLRWGTVARDSSKCLLFHLSFLLIAPLSFPLTLLSLSSVFLLLSLTSSFSSSYSSSSSASASSTSSLSPGFLIFLLPKVHSGMPWNLLHLSFSEAVQSSLIFYPPSLSHFLLHSPIFQSFLTSFLFSFILPSHLSPCFLLHCFFFIISFHSGSFLPSFISSFAFSLSSTLTSCFPFSASLIPLPSLLYSLSLLASPYPLFPSLIAHLPCSLPTTSSSLIPSLPLSHSLPLSFPRPFPPSFSPIHFFLPHSLALSLPPSSFSRCSLPPLPHHGIPQGHVAVKGLNWATAERSTVWGPRHKRQRPLKAPVPLPPPRVIARGQVWRGRSLGFSSWK